MKKKYDFDQCLSFQELEWFVIDSTDNEDRVKIKTHISECELCNRAVDGFTAFPYSIDVVNKLNSEIDLKSKAPFKFNSVFFSQVSIVIISLFAIIGFYVIAESVSENKNRLHHAKAVKLAKPNKIEKTKIASVIEYNTKSTSVVLPIYKNIKTKSVEQPIFSIESLSNISASLNELLKNNVKEPTSDFNSTDDVVFIDGFKIADFHKLYFKYPFEMLDLTNYTPSSIENKKTKPFLITENEQNISLLKQLKKGIHYYKKQKYEDAITAFQLLTDNNENDVNALFYIGLSCYESKRFVLAEKYFGKVLANTTTCFYEEGKWKLANTLLKEGKKEEAKKLFEEIKNEKGFYAN